jgi:thioredoxin 1
MTELITDNNFEEKIKEGITLVDFYAEWCQPCKVLSPIVDEISVEILDANVYKMDVEESSKTSQLFSIRSIPTLIVFKDGKLVKKIVGSATKEQINSLIDAAR